MQMKRCYTMGSCIMNMPSIHSILVGDMAHELSKVCAMWVGGVFIFGVDAVARYIYYMYIHYMYIYYMYIYYMYIYYMYIYYMYIYYMYVYYMYIC